MLYYSSFFVFFLCSQQDVLAPISALLKSPRTAISGDSPHRSLSPQSHSSQVSNLASQSHSGKLTACNSYDLDPISSDCSIIKVTSPSNKRSLFGAPEFNNASTAALFCTGPTSPKYKNLSSPIKTECYSVCVACRTCKWLSVISFLVSSWLNFLGNEFFWNTMPDDLTIPECLLHTSHLDSIPLFGLITFVSFQFTSSVLLLFLPFFSPEPVICSNCPRRRRAVQKSLVPLEMLFSTAPLLRTVSACARGCPC